MEYLRQRAPRLHVHDASPGQRRMACREVPVPARARRVGRGRQRKADHGRVGTAHDRLGDVARGAHRPVGDHMAVHAGLIEVTHAGGASVGNGRGLGSVEAEHVAGGAHMPRAGTDQHAGRAGAHQVKSGLVAHAAPDDDRRLHAPDERLEVERVARGGDVLGRDDRSRDDQQIDVGGDGVGGEFLGPLGPHPARGSHPDGCDLRNAGGHQLGLDRPGVQLPQAGCGRIQRRGGQLGQVGLGVLATGPDALQVEHPHSPELSHPHRGGRAGHTVGRGGQHRDVEPVGVDLPGDVHVGEVAGPPAGDDGDLVEPVGAATGLAQPDLDFSHRSSPGTATLVRVRS